MERFDVAVVGAGPAGSMTAYHLAAAGASVLLVDRARFPRDKLSGTLASSWAAKRVLDRFPQATFAVASTPPLQRALARLARGDPQALGIALAGRVARRIPISSAA